MNARQVSSTSYPITFKLRSVVDGETAVSGLSPTVTISKNGGAFAAAAGAVAEIGSTGVYTLAGNATDRNTLGELRVKATGAGAHNFNEAYSITTDDPFAASPTAAAIRAEIDSNSTQLAAIVADTNELQSDDVPGLIAALNDPSVADILTTQMTEAYAAAGVAPTLAQCLFYIQQHLRERGISGTTETVKKLDGATTAATNTINDATNPTSVTAAT